MKFLLHTSSNETTSNIYTVVLIVLNRVVTLMATSHEHKISLNELGIGQIGVISDILKEDSLLYRKLLSMGIVKGTEIQLANVAPLGCPIEIRARGYSLSLRRSEARSIQVDMKPTNS